MTTKIGIATIHGKTNYGGALQEFALQRVIREMGYDPETVNFSIPILRWYDWFFRRLFTPAAYIRVLKKRRFCRRYRRELEEAPKRFRAFYQNGRSLSRRYEEVSDLRAAAPEYAACVTGSDQVWNPRLLWAKEYYMLGFMPEEKRISYAASMGVNQLHAKLASACEEYLRNFAAISVRESNQVRLLGDILHRPVVQVLDPTLLLNAATWLEWLAPFVVDTVKFLPKEPYIFCYAIIGWRGDVVTRKALRAARKLADAMNVRVYAPIMRFNEGPVVVEEGVTPLFGIGPAEFVHLIHGAKAVVSNSFHATAFSINFRKPFLIQSDSDNEYMTMNARFSSILEMFQLSERMISSPENVKPQDLEMDYSHVDAIQSQWQEKSLNFLREALEKCTRNSHQE